MPEQDSTTREGSWSEGKATPRFIVGAGLATFMAAGVVSSIFTSTHPRAVKGNLSQSLQSRPLAEHGDCTADQVDVAQRYIQAWGYTCSDVSSCIPSWDYKSVRINCSLRYTYYLKDKGGNWVVELGQGWLD